MDLEIQHWEASFMETGHQLQVWATGTLGYQTSKNNQMLLKLEIHQESSEEFVADTEFQDGKWEENFILE